MLATWRASREAGAKRITAVGDADVLAILAGGQARALSTIAEAQESARKHWNAPDIAVEGKLTITNAVEQHMRFQQERQLGNISNTVGQAAAILTDVEVEDHEPDHDWAASFFNYVQDVSSEEMQILWARVLAGEVKRPGSTSIKTLGLLRDLDQGTAKLFRNLCSIAIFYNGLHYLEGRVLNLGRRANWNDLSEYGLPFDSLNILNEYALITPHYDSYPDYLEGAPTRSGNDLFHEISIYYQGQPWILQHSSQDPRKEFPMSAVAELLAGVLLTRSGVELSSVVTIEEAAEYNAALMDFLDSEHLQMIK